MCWKVAAGKIIGHRLAYVPCPIELDKNLLLTDPIIDVWELARCSNEPEVVLRGPVRFEYDPFSVKELHPASHFTFNGSDCRIPVASPVGPNEFIRFIFRNFYPEIWQKSDYLQTLRPAFDREKTLKDVEHEEIHLRWERCPGSL